MPKNTDLLISSITDISSLFVPSGTISEFVKQSISNRIEEKRNIVIDEIRAGKITAENVDDDFVSCIWRLHNSFVQGETNTNVRLLAKMIVGLINTSQPLYADKFLNYCKCLEGVSYEELMILSEIWNCYNNFDLEQEDKDFSKMTNQAIEQYKKGKAVVHAQQKITKNGSLSLNDDDFNAILIGLSRTGFVIVSSAFGGLAYRLSPKFEELIQLINCNLSDLLNE